MVECSNPVLHTVVKWSNPAGLLVNSQIFDIICHIKILLKLLNILIMSNDRTSLHNGMECGLIAP